MWAQAINIVLGLLVMIAPALFSMEKTMSNNLHITGPLIVTFALTALWEVNRNVRWFNYGCGAWLLASPLVLGYRGPGLELILLIGLLVILFSLFKGKIEKPYGGGWRSLLQKEPLHMRKPEAGRELAKESA